MGSEFNETRKKARPYLLENDFSKMLAVHSGYPIHECRDILKSFKAVAKEAIIQNYRIRLAGFCILEPYTKPPRGEKKYFDPKDKEYKVAPPTSAYNIPHCSFSENFREEVRTKSLENSSCV